MYLPLDTIGGMELRNESPEEPYPSALDRQTLAEDRRYLVEIFDRKPATFFRPGDRTKTFDVGYWESNADGISFIRFIAQYGNHEKGRRPLFLEIAQPVRVLSLKAKKLKKCSVGEYTRAYTELSSAQAVLKWLRRKYPTQELTLESVVTVYMVSYIE